MHTIKYSLPSAYITRILIEILCNFNQSNFNRQAEMTSKKYAYILVLYYLYCPSKDLLTIFKTQHAS
jgi:hypothetical protein